MNGANRPKITAYIENTHLMSNTLLDCHFNSKIKKKHFPSNNPLAFYLSTPANSILHTSNPTCVSYGVPHMYGKVARRSRLFSEAISRPVRF